MNILSCAIALTLLALVACRRPDVYPITQQPVPFSALSDQAGTAPNRVTGVTGDRIRRARDAEPHNWLTYYGAYDGQRYSPLDQITAANAGTLKVAWQFQNGIIGLVATPAIYAFEAAPIVVDGVMYTSGPDGYVWALDAVTGRELWRYRHAIPLDVPLCCGNVNRGVAVGHGKVYFATPHGHLVALDASTGKPVWDKAFVDPRAGESATAAPLLVKNLVIAGSSGAEYGVRGHLDAFDAQTGERRWRLYTIPKPGERGSETWETPTAWERGGGTTWITGTYDPELDLVYWGTANPGPVYDGDSRPGANLFTNSVLAIDPDDGAIRWHFQFTPHDVWDYDGVNENILFEQDGRKLLAHFDRNGYLYVLDRTNGAVVNVTRFGDRVTWGEVDARGRVTVKLTPTPEGRDICPGPAGAKEWPHAAFSRQTGLLYAPVVDVCATFKSSKSDYEESMPFFGSIAAPHKGPVSGAVKAFDPLTGRVVWTHRTRHPMVASVLATAGGVVFTGEPTGEFIALDARTGQQLYRFQTGSGIHSSPITYSVNGRQYVAVWSGWGGWVEGFAPELYGQSRGGALVVFSLP